MTDSEKLDAILERLSETINLWPDSIKPDMPQYLSVQVTTNHASPIHITAIGVDRPDGRYLRLDIRGQFYEPLKSVEWKCVYNDPLTGRVIDKPGMLPTA